ncbi:MAG: outer membrane protein assembly factor BamC [Betaproteobacteria bacterium]
MRTGVQTMRGTALALLSVALAACSSLGLESDKIDYKAVDRQKPLDIPPDLTQLPTNDRFAVPGAVSASELQARQQAVRPAAATAPAAAANATPAAAVAGNVVPPGQVARLERSGSQRWLVVNLPPEKTFEEVVDFWRSVGLGVERENPQTGVIETVWAENRAKLPQDIIRSTIGKVFDFAYSTGEQDKYRARIERTADGNSEVFISHRGMIEVYADSEKVTTRWQPRPADPELEAEMLQRLATRLNQPAGQATAARRPPAGSAGAATAATSTPETTRMVQSPDGRNVRLQVDENLDRAWRRVGLALDRGGFTVEDRDRARGFYLVRYLDPDYEAKQREKQGFFSRLFGGEAKVEAPQFRVQLTDAGNGRTDIAVLDKDGNPTIGSAVDRMLALLRDQLRT